MERKMVIAGAASKKDACIKYISEKYKAEGYEVQLVPVEEGGQQGILIQMRNTTQNTASGWLKKLSGLETCATVKLVDAGDGLSVEVLAGKWLDKIAAGAVSMVVLWPLFITASVGAIKQKAMLDRVWDETVSFLSTPSPVGADKKSSAGKKSTAAKRSVASKKPTASKKSIEKKATSVGRASRQPKMKK